MTAEFWILYGATVAGLFAMYILASIAADKTEVWLLRRQIRLRGVDPLDRLRLDAAVRVSERK